MITSGVAPQTDRTFYQVGGEYPEKMDVLTEIFNRILEPLYGPQDKAIQQIRESKDRKCFLLYENDLPAGVIAFKTGVSDEFADLGVKNSIEVKSLFVDQSAQNSGRGLGSALVDKLKREVELLGIAYDSIHVTVSETKPESLMFFQKKGFVISHAWKDRYLKGVTEYLLCCPRILQGIQPTVEDLVQGMSGLSTSEKEAPELLHIIHNAHMDDIHCLIRLSDGTFISGSKDNCLYKWNNQGKLVKIVDEVEPTNQSEANWITALEVVNDEYFVSGARHGQLVLWKTNGEYVKELKAKMPRPNDHISLPLNKRRITCLSAGTNPNKPSVFVGLPTMFDSFNLIEGRTESATKVHANDWVYAIKPLTDTSILTVVGATIELWNQTGDDWAHGGQLMPEQKRYYTVIDGKKRQQRAFISDVTALDAQKRQFAVASFDSTVKILDLPTRTIVQTWQEHQGRVWKLEKFTDQIFASSAEDGTVKLWDVRVTKKSARTINVANGQVTAMLALDDHTLLTGSCADAEKNKPKSAEIRFYELRK